MTDKWEKDFLFCPRRTACQIRRASRNGPCAIRHVSMIHATGACRVNFEIHTPISKCQVAKRKLLRKCPLGGQAIPAVFISIDRRLTSTYRPWPHRRYYFSKHFIRRRARTHQGTHFSTYILPNPFSLCASFERFPVLRNLYHVSRLLSFNVTESLAKRMQRSHSSDPCTS